MPRVEPLRALHYDPAVAGPLQHLAAPPYDVIDAPQRAELQARSPYNVVGIDLPEDPAGGDRYEHAAALLEAWRGDGAVVLDDEPAIWALVQDYTAPDGRRLTRNGFFAISTRKSLVVSTTESADCSTRTFGASGNAAGNTAKECSAAGIPPCAE